MKTLAPSLRLTRGTSIALLVLTLLATALFTTSDASANETQPADWRLASLGDIDDGPTEVSGVAVDDDGAIYVIDDNGLLFCVTRDGGPDGNATWDGEAVTDPAGEFDLTDKDTEGISWIGDDKFVVAWENDSGNTSGLTEFTMSGTSVGSDSETDYSLPGVVEYSGQQFAGVAGGAEGVASIDSQTHWVVQEGVVSGNGVDPTLHLVDTSLPNPVAETVTLQPDTPADSAGVAIEPGTTGHVWVISESDRQLRKFRTSDGEQVASLSTPLADPEGVAFTPDGIHMIVVGEGTEIAIYEQAGSAAPLPTGNCDGPPTPCPDATMSVTPGPLQVGDTIEIQMTINDCDPRLDITRTRMQAWREDVTWIDSLIDVNAEVDTHTFVGTLNASGTSDLRVHVWLRFEDFNDDGTPTVDGQASLRLTESVTVGPAADGPPTTLVQIQNVLTGRFLDSQYAKVTTDTDGDTLWNFVDSGDGTFHVVNSANGRFLDIDNGWVARVRAKTVAGFGSRWVLREHAAADGAITHYITNADFTAESGHSRTNLRTTYAHASNSWVSTTSWNSTHTRWMIQVPA